MIIIERRLILLYITALVIVILSVFFVRVSTAAELDLSVENEHYQTPAERAAANEETSGYNLTEDERNILKRVEISPVRHIIGGILGTYPGFGIGHAVQGRYLEGGWIFTVAEIGSAVLVFPCLMTDSIEGEGPPPQCGLAALGAVVLLGARVWEVVDVWAGPVKINRKFQELKKRIEKTGGSGFITPDADGNYLIGMRWEF